MHRKDLHRLARAGAEARIEAIQREIDSLRRQFPTLGGPPPKRGRPYTGASAAILRAKRTISAAGRKRIGDAARKRWAKWRKQREREPS